MRMSTPNRYTGPTWSPEESPAVGEIKFNLKTAARARQARKSLRLLLLQSPNKLEILEETTHCRRMALCHSTTEELVCALQVGRVHCMVPPLVAKGEDDDSEPSSGHTPVEVASAVSSRAGMRVSPAPWFQIRTSRYFLYTYSLPSSHALLSFASMSSLCTCPCLPC